MLADQRQAAIYDLIRKDGSVKTIALKSMLGVSEMTVRRDLEELEARNLIRRVHGGAVASLDRLSESSFAVNAEINVEKKLAIAHRAAQFVENGMYVALDASSTVSEFARLLKSYQGITIITNSLGVLWEFHTVPNARVMVLGGSLAIDGNSIEGTFAVDNASNLFVDTFFFSCAGFNADGVTNATPVASEVRKMLLKNARQSILLADSSKYGKNGFIKLFDWSDVDVLVSDSGLSKEAQESILASAPHLRIEVADTVS